MDRSPQHLATPGDATMADVARAAGVSVATVSRALRDVEGVSPATRRHVREVADRLWYVVSPEASGLARRVTGRVAVVVPRVDWWFYATMLRTLEGELSAAGLDLLLYQVDGADERRRFLEDLPARKKVDAVVVVALPIPPDGQERLQLMGVHVVVAGGRLDDYPCVWVDDLAMARAAVERLVDLGHERIAMIRTKDTDGTDWPPDVDRTATYRTVLAEHDIEAREEYLVSEPHSLMAGRYAMERLLALPEPPTAVFAYADELAVSAVAALQRARIAVPAQMSLIGVDGHYNTEVFGLDTVDQDVPAQARAAGRMTAALVRGETLENVSVEVPWRMVERGSTAPPRG